jgi:tetratricopeptide (TPR) repeat protein
MASKFDDAIQTLSQVLVMDPDHSEARERLRVSTVRKNLWPRLEALKQNAAHHPENAAARDELADAYKSFGMYVEAEQEYLKALELEPGNFDYKLSLCIDYAEWGKVDQSVDCYKDVVKRKQHHVLYWSLGAMYDKQGKTEEAIAAYQKSLELKPEFDFALYALASAYIKQGRNQEAIPPLQKLLEVEPKHVFGNHALGLVYARMGNKTAAMQQYYILQNLDAHAAAELLRLIPK